MAKAIPALSTGEITSNPAIAAAATEIHTLINSKPQSPSRDELVAVIAAYLGTARADTPAHRAEWDQLMYLC